MYLYMRETQNKIYLTFSFVTKIHPLYILYIKLDFTLSKVAKTLFITP